LYDIRPGNGAGLFLQPRSLHGSSAKEGLFLSSSVRLSVCQQENSKWLWTIFDEVGSVTSNS